MYSRLHSLSLNSVRNRLAKVNNRYCYARTLKAKDYTASSIQAGQVVHGFKCLEVEHIKEYNMTAYYLRHVKNSAEYLHLERDDPNNVFCVGFRTTPLDSMGTPHILEHIVLCGSEKFPVRDPFFKMLNRSLATYMNALTGPDYTVYPFSSINEVDYRNLQRVYMDAVFKPNLKYLDFLQEGWRLEHEKVKDRNSKLKFKGVVYNEMKGAFSDNSSVFGQKFLNTILPKGTYGFVSGGDPVEIPNITHDHLKKFHKKYYHPSNGGIYSYGNFPLEKNLKFVNEEYLSKYEFLDPSNTIVQQQERWDCPRKEIIHCRVDQYGPPLDKQNQIAIGYIQSDITDVYETFMLTALAELMIIGPNSAFYKSLIEKNISGGYNSLTGYDNQIRDTLFVIGLKDLEKSAFCTVENIITETLEDLHKNGFEKAHIDSVLHSFELAIKHQSPKFGLDVLLNIMPLWNHDGPILYALRTNELLQKLKSNLTDKNYVRNVLEKYFISNNHKLIMTMEPDKNYEINFRAQQDNLLKKKTEKLTKAEKEKIYLQGLELYEVQKKEEDIHVLPCLKLDEIKVNKVAPSLQHTVIGTIPIQLCEASTGGVTYFKGILGTESLSDKQMDLLPFFYSTLDKFDTEKYNYRDFDQFIMMSTSGITVMPHVSEHIGQPGQFEQGIIIGSHCLDENVPKMLEVWAEILKKPIFGNPSRLKMLFNNHCSLLNSAMVDNGHTYAIQAAKSLISSTGQTKNNLIGIQHVINMLTIQKNLDVAEVQTILSEIADQVLTSCNLRAAFHYSDTNKDVHEHIDNFCNKVCLSNICKEMNRINWVDSKEMPKQKQGIHISMDIPVHFCAKVIPTVPYTHPDFAKLRVLSKILTSKYLHPVVREQNGAYGSGIVLSIDGQFNFYSYRDPNSIVTLNVFDDSAEWVMNNTSLFNDQNLFESKLSILRQMDQPMAEYMKGIDLFLFGLSYDIWKTQRDRVLAVEKDDVVEVCEKYLKNNEWVGKCVIGTSYDKELVKSDEVWTTMKGPIE